MTPEEEQVISEIARLRDNIKRKYLQIKFGDADAERVLTKQYSPIIKEISKIRRLQPKMEIKKEEEEEMDIDKKEEEEEDDASQHSVPNFIDTEVIAESEPSPMHVESTDESGPSVTPVRQTSAVKELLSTPSGQEDSVRYVHTMFKHRLPRTYVLRMIKDHKNTIDNTYGPRITGDGTVMIGNKYIRFDDENGDIIIDGDTYKGTEGLYELIFMRKPDENLYTNADLNTYKQICEQTSAHRKGYNHLLAINRASKSAKYKSVISRLFPPTGLRSGKGYAYWDNPNELCDRLRLLLSSQEVGHTGHENEIASIIEELREAGFIKGSGNRKIRTLIR